MQSARPSASVVHSLRIASANVSQAIRDQHAPVCSPLIFLVLLVGSNSVKSNIGQILDTASLEEGCTIQHSVMVQPVRVCFFVVSFFSPPDLRAR